MIHLEATLRTLTPGPKLTKLCRVYPHGSLYARMESGGSVAFWWRWTFQDEDDKERIGLWDRSADPRNSQPTPGGWSVTAAMRQAEEWAREHEQFRGVGGFRAARETQERVEQEERALPSFGSMLQHYIEELEKREAQSATDVRLVFRKHVERANKPVWDLPAASVTREEVAQLVRMVVTNGHHRTANKLRSYLHAAFGMALGATADASIPAHFKSYKVVHNPVAGVPPAKAERTGKLKARPKALFTHDMRIYWEKIAKVPGQRGAALRLHLLTGGQRPKQLARATADDVMHRCLRLLDRKGRDAVEREHVVPLTDLAMKALEEANSGGKYLLSTDGGKTPLSDGVLCDWAQEAVGDALPGFTIKLIRSGVETLLTQYGVSEEHRGRLQSHGISGVQAKHYNAWEFMDEKRAALDVLEAAIVYEIPPKPVEHPSAKAMYEAKAAALAAKGIAPEIQALR